MILYACETCCTFSPDEPLPRHALHNVIAIEGEDYEEVSRTAAAHLVIARRIKNGTVGDGLTSWAMSEARMHADWFSEEDADANPD